MTSTPTTCVTACRPTKGRASYTAARPIAATFGEIEITAAGVGTSARSESFVAVVLARVWHITMRTVASATTSAQTGTLVITDFVGMLSVGIVIQQRS
ncbi:hypothetical protein LguiA_023104 [Lonicera macranthoides]